jgi:thiamine-phosphate pyrophosphorylase
MIVLISPEEAFEEEINLVNLMFKVGLDRYHIRRPSLDQRGHLAELKTFSKSRYGQISIHGGLPKGAIRKRVGMHKKSINDWGVLEASALSSASFHSESEIASDISKVDYAMISPVFDSISKQGYLSKYSAKEWLELNKKRKTTHPKSILLALGGIKEANLEVVFNMGFDGVALMGAVWGTSDPLVTFTKISKKWWDIVEANK